MNHRSPYDPGARGIPLEGIEVRAATPADAGAIARIDAEWLSRDVDELESVIARDLVSVSRDEERYVCVAFVRQKILGYGKCAFLRWSGQEDPDLPDGWYLTGVTVAREARRQGIGRALIAHRLEWLAARAEEVYFNTGESNRPSQDLHAPFGFEIVKSGFRTGVGAIPGEPVRLYRRSLL